MWNRIGRAAMLVMAMAATVLQSYGQPLTVFAGEGMVMVVADYAEDTGAIRGELRREGRTFPFKATMRPGGSGDIITGQYVSGGRASAFRVREVAGSDEVIFISGGEQRRMRPSGELAGPIVADSAPKPERPTPQTSRPAVPTARPARQAAAPVAAGVNPPAAGRASGTASSMRLKLHTFPDVSMGGVAAYTVLLPPGWSAEGHIEWDNGPTPHPQKNTRIRSPNGGVLAFSPTLRTMYYETTPVPGFGGMPPQGTPPPGNFPQWFAGFAGQAGQIRNVRLVEAQRDPASEAQWAQNGLSGPRPDQGKAEAWMIVLEYDEAGVRRREGAGMTYYRHPPMINENIRSFAWSVIPNSSVSAPVEHFDALAPQLYATGATMRPTAKWFVQSQALLAQLSQQRIANAAELIRQRARVYDQISNEQMASYRRRMASEDRSQRRAVNGIWERTDYHDGEGTIVALPSQYNHAYTDGQGNYLLSNNPSESPGVDWRKLETAR